MNNLDLEKFHPQKAEIIMMAEKYRNLSIADINDREGYKAVDAARKELKATRVQIEKDGKAFRAEAVAFQKKVLALENELVGIIEPIEDDLAAKQKAIDEEKAALKFKQEQEAKLPGRKTLLADFGCSYSDDELCSLSDVAFTELLQKHIDQRQQETERKLAEEKAALEKEKQAFIDKQLEAERAAAAAAKKIEDDRLEAERAKARAEEIEAVRLQAVKDAEAKARQEALDKIEAEKAAQLKLEKRKKYQEFLEKNQYVSNSEEFFIVPSDKKVILYKKIGEFII